MLRNWHSLLHTRVRFLFRTNVHLPAAVHLRRYIDCHGRVRSRTCISDAARNSSPREGTEDYVQFGARRWAGHRDDLRDRM